MTFLLINKNVKNNYEDMTRILDYTYSKINITYEYYINFINNKVIICIDDYFKIEQDNQGISKLKVDNKITNIEIIGFAGQNKIIGEFKEQISFKDKCKHCGRAKETIQIKLFI